MHIIGMLLFFKSKPLFIINFGCLERRLLYVLWCLWFLGEHFVQVRKKPSNFCFNKLNFHFLAHAVRSNFERSHWAHAK